jgi:hypothetical protein
VHHLRKLTYVFEEMKQPWAGQMIELLSRANRLDRERWADASTPEYDSLHSVLQAQGAKKSLVACVRLKAPTPSASFVLTWPPCTSKALTSSMHSSTPSTAPPLSLAWPDQRSTRLGIAGGG